MLKQKFIIVLILMAWANEAAAQPFNLRVNIINQPSVPIIVGSLMGDKFTPFDSIHPVISLNDKGISMAAINLYFPKDAVTGMYRIIFGQTTYAKIMNEPPQYLDFVFNNEDIHLITDFRAPDDSVQVVQSDENKIWFSFLKEEKRIIEQLNLAQLELEFYQSKESSAKDMEKMLSDCILRFNQLQTHKSDLIERTLGLNPDMFASRLVKMYREPFLNGNLSVDERDQIYKDNFFNQLDFSDESLMNSSVLTKKVFVYLMNYAKKGLSREKQEEEFMKAIDAILTNVNQNEKVYEFILDYLVTGFEQLKMDNLITYIAQKYSDTTCQTDGVSTLERKLLQQKMVIGTLVPDFEMADANGNMIALSSAYCETNLILFWASWCPHCEEMITGVKNMLSTKNHPNMRVFAISLDPSRDAWLEKIQQLNIESWINLSDHQEWDGQTVIDYNVFATPTVFIVDKNRVIKGKPIDLKELRNYFGKD